MIFTARGSYATRRDPHRLITPLPALRSGTGSFEWPSFLSSLKVPAAPSTSTPLRSLRKKEKQTLVFKNHKSIIHYAFNHFRPLHLLWFLWLPQVGLVSCAVVFSCCLCSCWLPRVGRVRRRCRCVFPVSFPCRRGFQCC